MSVSVLIVAGEYSNNIYGYAPLYDYSFLISATSVHSVGPTGSWGFSQVGEGFVFQGEIGFDDTLYYSDGGPATAIEFAANGDSLDAPWGFLEFAGKTVFVDYFNSPIYITDGSNAPQVLLNAGSSRSYLKIGDTLFAKTGADFHMVESDLSMALIYDDDANTTGVDLGSGSYYFEFGGDLWVRGDGSSGLANDFYRYDISAGTWSEMNIAENSGGDSLRFSFNMVGDTQFFGWISGANGIELHVSNGAANNWAQVADIRPGTSNSYVDADLSGMIGDRLIFVADDGGADDEQLWVSDGTALGTFAISGTGSAIGAFNSFLDFASNGTLVFFTAYGPTGLGLYATDGTDAGTRLLLDPNSNRIYIREVTDDGVYFASDAGDDSQLWFSDGTAAGTSVVANFSPEDSDTNTNLGFMDFVELKASNIPVYEQLGSNDTEEIIGINLRDYMEGLDGQDTLGGLDGKDTLKGGAGADLLLGGRGDDVLSGGRGYDRIEGENGNDQLFGHRGNDTLKGGKGADLLEGASHDDRLLGQRGADTLKGGTGDDYLVGGSGKDLFVFRDGDGNDTIQDFDALANGEDIDLSAVTAIAGFTDLAAHHMQQVGADVLIDDGAGLTILLLNVDESDLGQGDFLF